MSSATPTSPNMVASDVAVVAPIPPKEDWELQRDEYKKFGDDAFRSQQWGESIRHYTEALSLDPTFIVLLSNRSAAYLKNQEKSKALHDAQECVRLDPSFVKGHSRLAAALQALQRWKPACEAYQQVIEMDPGNAIAKQGLAFCMETLNEEAEETREHEETGDTIISNGNVTCADGGNVPSGDGDEDDLLDSFFSEVETVGENPSQPHESESNVGSSSNAIMEHKTDLGNADSQIARLLAPNYAWRNLNPFYVLDISHEASTDDISKRYKALSLLLHPDKCRNLPNAKEAYDEVQRAKAQLDDPDKAKHVRQLIAQGRKMGNQEWRAGGQKGVLEELQAKAVQRIFAEIEHKRREVEKRQRKQEQREREQEEEEIRKERKSRDFDKNWREDTRVESRIGSWRDFSKKNSSKKQKM